MNKLTSSERTKILHLLVEGNAIRAVERLTGTSKNTIIKLLVDAGKACLTYHDEHVRGVKAKQVQVDEIWSFVHAKQKNAATAKAPVDGAGDVWTRTALEAESKLIISYLVGGRDSEYSLALMDDLRGRLANRVQLTTDGHKAYLSAVEEAFGDDIDFSQLVKLFGAAPEVFKGRYSPADCIGTKKTQITGNPDEAHASTSYVERQNLTIRMHNRRFTRLTNAFSTKVENHAYSVALHMMYYNFCRMHKTLRMTPAMAAGVSDKLWEVSDIVKLVEDAEAAAATKVRGPYKKRVAEISN